MTNKERAFLIGLEKLTRETGLVLGGCGCCGSPFVSETTPAESVDDAGYGFHPRTGQIMWISPDDSYDWDNYRGLIVKEEVPDGRP